MGPLISRLTEMDSNWSLARCVCTISDLNSLPYSCMLRLAHRTASQDLKTLLNFISGIISDFTLFCFISREHLYNFSSLYEDINVPKVCPEYRKLKTDLSSWSRTSISVRPRQRYRQLTPSSPGLLTVFLSNLWQRTFKDVDVDVCLNIDIITCFSLYVSNRTHFKVSNLNLKKNKTFWR